MPFVTISNMPSKFFAIFIRKFSPSSGNHKTGCESFYIPFPRAWKRFVKIIYIKNQFAFWSCKSAKIHQVAITAKLKIYSRYRSMSQIGSHNGSGTSVKCKRRFHHSSVPNRQQAFNPSFASLN
ncbi:hypothetical protein D3C72_1053050 [compost metagenome]